MSNANPLSTVENFSGPSMPPISTKKVAGCHHPRTSQKARKSSGEDSHVYTYRIYLLAEGVTMSKARIFKSGNSQAVRLPKEFRFDVQEVEIFRRGDEVVLRKPKRSLRRALAILRALPEDFMADGRQDSPPQQREPL
jgi:antitoxin VapB